MAVTPNLLIPIDIPGTTAGPTTFQWAVDNELFKTIVDSHAHLGTAGSGLQIVSAAININADLGFNAFNATNFRSLRLANNAAPLALPADLGCVYESGGNLYYNSSAGAQVQLTAGGAINLSSTGGFTGLAGTTAAATYSVGLTTFIFTSASTLSASLDAGTIIVRQPGLASAKGVSLKSPTSLAADYNLIFPAALPASTVVMTMDASGNIATPALPITTQIQSTNGYVVPQAALATATTPPASGATIYTDSISTKVSTKNSAGVSYPLYMLVANKVLVPSFNTTATIVAGGATAGGNAPTINCKLPANSLYVGSIIRIRIAGFCTTTVANTVTVALRIGAAGTTADASIVSWAFSAAASGTNTPFTMTITAVVNAIGASATIQAGGGSGSCMLELLNTTTIGIFNQPTGLFTSGASGTFDSTAALFVSLSMLSSAVTTTFPQIMMGTIEIL